MKRWSIVAFSLLVLAGSAVGLYAFETETFRGTAARSGTHKRPRLDVDGKRYELKASDKADASVQKMLAKFSKGDTGSYAVLGTDADGIMWPSNPVLAVVWRSIV